MGYSSTSHSTQNFGHALPSQYLLTSQYWGQEGWLLSELSEWTTTHSRPAEDFPWPCPPLWRNCRRFWRWCLAILTSWRLVMTSLPRRYSLCCGKHSKQRP